MSNAALHANGKGSIQVSESYATAPWSSSSGIACHPKLTRRLGDSPYKLLGLPAATAASLSSIMCHASCCSGWLTQRPSSSWSLSFASAPAFKARLQLTGHHHSWWRLHRPDAAHAAWLASHNGRVPLVDHVPSRLLLGVAHQKYIVLLVTIVRQCPCIEDTPNNLRVFFVPPRRCHQATKAGDYEDHCSGARLSIQR